MLKKLVLTICFLFFVFSCCAWGEKSTFEEDFAQITGGNSSQGYTNGNDPLTLAGAFGIGAANMGFTRQDLEEFSPYRDSWLTIGAKGVLSAHNTVADSDICTLFVNGVIISLGVGVLIAKWGAQIPRHSSIQVVKENLNDDEYIDAIFAEENDTFPQAEILQDTDSFYLELNFLEKIILLFVMLIIVCCVFTSMGFIEPIEGCDELSIAGSSFVFVCVWLLMRYLYYLAYRIEDTSLGNILRLLGTFFYFVIIYGYGYYSVS